MSEKDLSLTQKFLNTEKGLNLEVNVILTEASKAMIEKGYNPTNQLVGYILSGDPTYITSHKGARNLITKVERDELLEELINSYLNKYNNI